LILAGCPPQEDPPASSSEPDDQTLLQELYAGAKQSLDEFVNPDLKPLPCPGEYTDTAIRVTSGSGAPTDDILACLRQDTGRRFVLVVRNQADVPLTLRGRLITDVWTVKPNKVLEIDLANVRFGQWLRFEPNLYAGIATAVTNYLQDKAQPAAKWRRCVDEGINAKCVADGLSDLLPEQVRVGRFEVPIAKIAEVLLALMEYKPLVDAWQQQAAGTATGRLMIAERG
jgi:hypothetical protein